MLKARNIITIFVVNYLIILIVCAFMEMVFLSNKANEVQQMIVVAADMALEQVQATDDFFVNGGGYILNSTGDDLVSDYVYKMKVLSTGGEYKEVELFSAVSGKTTISEIYDYMYGHPDRLNKWITENPKVLAVDFLAARMSMVTGSIYSSYEGGTELRLDYFRVPSVVQLGLDSLDGNTGTASMSSLLNDSKTLGLEPRLVSATGLVTDPVIQEIYNNYDLWEAKKVAGLDTNNDGTADRNIEYYYTPLNLGLTYINEDLLSVLFMNNMELLMRSKYANRIGYNLQSEECGFGILKTSLYPDLVDTSINSDTFLNPINNGSFTLLRGERVPGTLYGSELYKGMKPKIEYVVIDMYGTDLSGAAKDLNDEMLQRVFGAKITETDASGNQLETTGENFYKLNEDGIQAQKMTYGSAIADPTQFDHKPIIVAKVTFYADVIIPYTTPSLREMRGRIENNSDDMSGRHLFDAFSNSPTDGRTAINENYVNIDTDVDNSFEFLYGEDGTGLDSHGDAFMYTTYFAVTP